MTGWLRSLYHRVIIQIARTARDHRSVRIRLLIVLAGLTVGGGVWGWILIGRDTSGGVDALSVAYATLALFYGEAPNDQVNLPLGVARLTGPLTTAGALLEAAMRLGHRQLQISAARFMAGHIVAVGSEARLRPYLDAFSESERRVLSIVDTETVDAVWPGVVAVPARGSSGTWIDRVAVHGAERVLIATGSDRENLAFLDDLLSQRATGEHWTDIRVQVEIDEPRLARLFALWLIRQHPTKDIDVVDPEADRIVRLLGAVHVLLDERGMTPPHSVALFGDTMMLATVFDRLATSLVTAASAHDGPEVPAVVIASTNSDVRAVRDREGGSLKVVELDQDLVIAGDPAAGMLDALTTCGVTVAVVDFKDRDLGVLVAGRLRYQSTIDHVLLTGGLRIPGVTTLDRRHVGTPVVHFPCGLIERLAVDAGAGSDADARRRLRVGMHQILEPGTDADLGSRPVTVSPGYRDGALEALPKAVLEHLRSAGLERLQHGMESVGLYFYEGSIDDRTT